MSKRNTWMVALLGFQIAFFGIIGWVSGSRQHSRIAPTKLLAGVSADKVKKIRIEEPDGAALVIARQDKDWVLPEAGGYPAARENVDKVLASLTGLESDYEVTGSADHHEELKVGKAFERKVTLDTDSGQKTLLVGSTGKAGMVHYRLADSATVFAGEGVRSWELGTRVAEWADKKYFEVDKNKVLALDVQKGASALHLSRTKPDAWSLEARPAQMTEANKLLDAASRIELSNVVGKAEEKAAQVKQAADVVTVTLGLAASPFQEEKPASDPQSPELAKEPGKKETVALSQVVEKKVLYLAPVPGKTTAYLAYLEGSPFVVEVDKYRVEDVLNADAGKLLGEASKDESKPSAPAKPTAPRPKKK